MTSIRTSLSSIQEFQQIIMENQGVIIIKFGADWCGPCKQIDPLVKKYMSMLPASIICYVIDVDQNTEVYGFLRSKKMVNGIPAILAYYKGNNSYVPNDVVIGANANEITGLFNRAIIQTGKL
jgi:thiol-disulfide isomerase/thioredoxin